MARLKTTRNTNIATESSLIRLSRKRIGRRTKLTDQSNFSPERK